jgi:hypothetical protein
MSFIPFMSSCWNFSAESVFGGVAKVSRFWR